MANFMKTATLQAANVGMDDTLDDALAGRSEIFTMTEQAHGAALTPGDPGNLSHDLRASLACRMARANAVEGLAGPRWKRGLPIQPSTVAKMCGWLQLSGILIL